MSRSGQIAAAVAHEDGHIDGQQHADGHGPKWPQMRGGGPLLRFQWVVGPIYSCFQSSVTLSDPREGEGGSAERVERVDKVLGATRPSGSTLQIWKLLIPNLEI